MDDMQDDSVIGPGVGTLIGLQYGEMRNAKMFARARASLDLAISDAQDEALLAKATKDAAKAVVNALLDEVFASDSGRLKAPKFSDAGAAARVEAYADTLEGQLRRLSDGRLHVEPSSLARIRTASCDLGQVLGEPSMAPKLARRA